MAAARAAARGLSADDIEAVRAALTAGRRPKVVFTPAAGQIAGQTGQVTALGDPATDEEWITVRFGRDELPFAPTDLQPAPKGGKATKATRAAVKAAPTTTDKAVPTISEGAVPEPTTSATASPAGSSVPTPSATAGPPAPRRTADKPANQPADKPAVRSADKPPEKAADKPARPRPAKAAGGRGSGKGPADLSVTLTWHDGDWSVQAQRGSKVIAKPEPVRAADALRMVGLLDSPEVTAAVEEVVEADRSAAEEQAERLRRELAEVEERLSQLPS